MDNQYLELLSKQIAKMPGLGPRSAKRAMVYLLQNKDNAMLPLANMMIRVANEIRTCSICGNLDLISPCAICNDSYRTDDVICVVENIADLWAMERNVSYRGKFHVLGGSLSAIDGIEPEDLRIQELIKRIDQRNIKEVILALNATVNGQTTSHYIAEKISQYDINITAIAHGIPIGGELDYLDDGTVATALECRKPIL